MAKEPVSNDSSSPLSSVRKPEMDPKMKRLKFYETKWNNALPTVSEYSTPLKLGITPNTGAKSRNTTILPPLNLANLNAHSVATLSRSRNGLAVCPTEIGKTAERLLISPNGSAMATNSNDLTHRLEYLVT